MSRTRGFMVSALRPPALFSLPLFLFCISVFQVWSGAWLPTVWTQSRMLEHGLVLEVMVMVTTPINSASLCCFSTWRTWRSSCTTPMRAVPMLSLLHQRCVNKSSRPPLLVEDSSIWNYDNQEGVLRPVISGSEWQLHPFSNIQCINNMMNLFFSVS